MKPNIRWQLLFAVTGFALVLALLGYHTQRESRLCSQQLAASGGVFVEGILGSPEYINPLLGSDNPVDRQLIDLLFDGLTRYEDNELVPALATSWQVGEDGRTVRFTLRDDAYWHDGQPFTAADVAFTYGLMQDDAFPGDPDLQRLWQSVVIREVSPQIIEFELREPYAGFLDATTTGILPQHILKDVSAAALPSHPFNQNPVGTGPFSLDGGQNWRRDGELLLIPTAEAWPQGTRIAAIAYRFFPEEQALIEALRGGEVMAISDVSPGMLPIVAQLPDIRLFSAPVNQYSSLIFNLGESGSEAIRSLAVRRALAYGLDQEWIIDQSLNGQGVAHVGPYLSSSWAYAPELLTVYGSDTISATVDLDEAGWLLSEGTDVREKEAQPLSLRFLVYDSPRNRTVAEEVEKELRALGVAAITMYAADWSDFQTALRDGNFDVALVEIKPANDPDLYDFWSQEAIIRGQNFAGWNRRRASEALESGRQVWPIEERKPYYATFLNYYDEDLPELALFQHIHTYAVSDSIEGLSIGRLQSVRDRYSSLSNWIMSYQDFTVVCPDEVDEPENL